MHNYCFGLGKLKILSSGVKENRIKSPDQEIGVLVVKNVA